jgi:hypothetical protein
MQPHPRPLAARLADERGISLIIALMSMVLMMALGSALILTTMTEGKIANNYSDGIEAVYAADAAVERVMQDILMVPDWNNIIDVNNPLTSAFVDGPPSGSRTIPGGTIDLGEATNIVNCGKLAVCSDADLIALTEERPWGKNNPRWKLYAYGPMSDMLPTETINSQIYVIVWVADDPSENDCDPLKDGETAACDGAGENLGRGVITMMAHAYGPNGVTRAIEVTLARTDTTEIERGYTGQRGQDEQNRRSRKAPVQRKEQALTRTALATGA